MPGPFSRLGWRDSDITEVATYRIRLNIPGISNDVDKLLPAWRGHRPHLTEMVQRLVEEELGPDHEVTFQVHSGSLEVWIVIGTMVMTAASYKNLVESLRLLQTQLNALFGTVMGEAVDREHEVETDVKLYPGEIVLDAFPETATRPSLQNRLLLYYLVVSHAILTAILAWLALA